MLLCLVGQVETHQPLLLHLSLRLVYPIRTPEKVSPVVEEATTAIQNTTPRYGSPNKPIKEKRTTSPVVAPTDGIIPMINPYNVPKISVPNNSIINLTFT